MDNFLQEVHMELFRETFTIMVVGMSLVFFFLFVVIQCMNAIAFCVRRYEAKAAKNEAVSEEDATKSRRIAAAIAVAMHTTEKH
jgi:sodium pump decarboxylase gamma subunit